MDALNFCYWLQGFFELDPNQYNNVQGLDRSQVSIIKEHLQLVFNKITKSVNLNLQDWKAYNPKLCASNTFPCYDKISDVNPADFLNIVSGASC